VARFPRFVFSPRWVALFAFALVVAVVCVRLGIWQLHRLHERRAFNAEVRAGLAAAPQSLDAVLAEAGDDPGSVAYRRVQVTGTYDTAHEVLLYGRALDGNPGHHVLTPLLYGDGAAVLVDRGWVPFEDDTPPVASAAPPSGEVTVTGFLLPAVSQGNVVIDRDASGRILTVEHDDPAALQGELPSSTLAPLPLQLQQQSPAQSGLPERVPPPELDEGPHLSYMIQWFIFATIAVVGYLILVWREMKDRERADRAASTE
jgi:cytochrome oxidase assembly protein ShyY1